MRDFLPAKYYYVYREARDVMQAEGNENIAKAYGRGAKQVRQHSMRIYNKDRLLKVNGFGPATTNVSAFRHACSPALAMQSPKPHTQYTPNALALCCL